MALPGASFAEIEPAAADLNWMVERIWELTEEEADRILLGWHMPSEEGSTP